MVGAGSGQVSWGCQARGEGGGVSTSGRGGGLARCHGGVRRGVRGGGG